MFNQDILNLFKNLDGVIKIVVLICLEIFVPFAYLLHIPFFVHHFLVRWIGPKINSKLGHIFSAMSAMGASDDIYTKPLYTVLLNYFVDGEIDINEHRQMFQKNILEARNLNGRLKYPELGQYIDTVYGYSFWVKDEDFQIENHIKLCDANSFFNLKCGQELNEETVMAATNEILIKPFYQKRSPWEILIFHGARAQNFTCSHQSLVIFRYHHSMSDGYSITKLLANVTTGEYYKNVQKKECLWKKILSMAIYPFVAAFAAIFIIPKYIDTHSWSFRVNSRERRDLSNSKKIRDVIYVCSDTVPISKIKQVKRQQGASFNEIILQGIAGGIRKYFLDHKITPEPMHVGLSFPVQGHPDKLTNHWTAVYLLLPLDVPSPQGRLRKLQKQFTTFGMMLFSKLAYLGPLYSGLLFRRFIIYIMTMVVRGSTITLSIFPGPNNLKLLTGENIISGGFVLGPLESQGVCITVVSYNGALRVFFGIERSLLDKEEDAKEIVRNITNEFFME